VNVIDSSVWIEYYDDGPNSDFFSAPIQDRESLVLPSICLYEVYTWVSRHHSEVAARTILADMQQGMLVALDSSLAVDAARLSLELDLDLPLADSVILATARAYEAVLWTQDADFKGLPGVRFRPHRS